MLPGGSELIIIFKPPNPNGKWLTTAVTVEKYAMLLPSNSYFFEKNSMQQWGKVLENYSKFSTWRVIPISVGNVWFCTIQCLVHMPEINVALC